VAGEQGGDPRMGQRAGMSPERREPTFGEIDPGWRIKPWKVS
jgi:hypothetical protein